jgi:hypothetical protein
MKFLRVLCVLAVALCLAGSVYAETQSIKVSGDLTMRALFRSDYDYRGSISEPDVTRTDVGSEAAYNWFMSVAEVQVDADLTDNVQTVIRLVNQRDWNPTNANVGNLGVNGGVAGKSIMRGTTLATNGLGGYNYNPNEFSVQVDLAYLTLKDFIYAPLTLTIGRQDLWFGKGFIVGLNQQDPTNALRAPEYTAINSFDAIKAVLDYDPLTITGLFSNIRTNAIQANDDVDLWGINAGYRFNNYKAEAEGYVFLKKDKSIEQWAGSLNGDNNNDIYTLGLRGSADPIEWVTLAGEGAYQFGSYVGNRLQVSPRTRQAFALDFSGEVRYFTEKYSWKPKGGFEYIYYSGQGGESNPEQTSGIYHGWDPIYRGKFDSKIREFVGRYYASYDYPVRPNFVYSTADASFTNQHQFIFSGSLQPIESLILKANYNLFWNDQRYLVGNVNQQPDAKTLGFIGQELDLRADWDYTEDVSFGILGAFFAPGEVYTNSKKTATDIIATVNVSF